MLKDPFNFKTIEERSDLIGLIGIEDKFREEITQAVATCELAGIQTYFLSENMPEYAEVMAEKMGLKDFRHLTGSDIEGLNTKELTSMLKDAVNRKKPMVFSSIHEFQKKKIVKVLQSLNQVVVVTGKDATDEPALLQSDIPV